MLFVSKVDDGIEFRTAEQLLLLDGSRPDTREYQARTLVPKRCRPLVKRTAPATLDSLWARVISPCSELLRQKDSLQFAALRQLQRVQHALPFLWS
jgi:hypothetical protein